MPKEDQGKQVTTEAFSGLLSEHYRTHKRRTKPGQACKTPTFQLVTAGFAAVKCVRQRASFQGDTALKTL